MDRFAIAQTLRKIGTLLALQGAPSFRAQAYAKGAAALESAEDFDRLVRSHRLKDLPGIGAGLSALISELATSGQCELLTELEAQLPPGALELSAILGLEPMKKLHEALGVDSIDTLEAACIAGRVREVRGFGDKSETRLLEKIRAHRARGSEMLLADAKALASELCDHLMAATPGLEVKVVGAVRRGIELVDRIELLAVGTLDAVAALTSFPRVARVETPEDEVAAEDEGLGQKARRAAHGVASAAPAARAWLADGICIVLWLVPSDDGLAELVRTGPEEHAAAVVLRLPPSARTAFAGAFASEGEVYARACLRPTPPELRDDPTMLMGVDAEPPALVTATDIQGLVHCHTTWSDGRNSVAEMAQAAAARGLRYITITDHSQAASYANGLDVDRLLRQWDEIDRVQATTSITILKGIESDILADGALDYPDAVLARLDLVIASIHARHAQAAPEMTARVVAMMRHPIRKIWGHPLGRLLQRRAPIDCDLDLILETAAATGTIFELNGDPHRMDLPVELARKARMLGIRFVASVDAHATTQLGYLDNAVTLARRAALTPDHVLNTLSSDAFVAAVRPFQ